jgi:hypothetical protein
MIASTGLWRRGAITAADYRARIDWFWNAMGRPAGYADSPPLGSPPVGSSPGERTAIPAPAAAPPAAAEPWTLADQLRGLADLRDQGLLTDEEFAAAKARLLGT